MKNLKSFLFVALFLISVSASAQISWGVKAGFNASTITGMNDAFSGLDFKYRPGFHVGVAAQCMFTPQMGIETGLYYSTLGTNGKYDISGNGVSYSYDVKFKSKMNPSYIQLPISFIYKFDMGNGLSLYPSAGLYFGYGIAGKIKFDLSGSANVGGQTFDVKDVQDELSEMLGVDLFEEEYDFFDKDAETNRFDLGATVGVNLGISNFTIGLGYDLGLLKINSESEDGMKNFYNRNIKVSVGYFF